MEANCPHLGADLSHAEIEDYEDEVVAVCPWHRYDFNLKTGASETGLRACVYDVELRSESEGVEPTVWLERPTNDESWEAIDVKPVSEGEIMDKKDPLSEPFKAFAEMSSEPVRSADAVGDTTHPTLPTTTSQEPITPHPAPRTLLEWSNLILNTPNARLKVERTRHAVDLFRTGKLKSIGRQGLITQPPKMPPREPSMVLVDPTKVARRGKGGSLKSRITMIHALANIEQWAIDLAWDIIARFGHDRNLPHQFYTDFTRMALEEAKHFSLLSNRLDQLGSFYGSLPIHSSLWESAIQTSDSLLARLAIIHLVHEARGLDVNPVTISKFEKAGDVESTQVLQIIHLDEITHVTTGHRWFSWSCEREGKDPVHTFRALVLEKFNGSLKGPFNADDRQKAGLGREYYDDIGSSTVQPAIPVAYEV